jgi:hypothetical protein
MSLFVFFFGNVILAQSLSQSYTPRKEAILNLAMENVCHEKAPVVLLKLYIPV